MPKPEFEFFDPKDLPWEPIPQVPGLSQKILSKDEAAGDYTRLLRFAPGCDTTPMGTQIHDFWEEVWIIEGGIFDIPLGKMFTAGQYACRPPGMRHGPWRAPEGCMTFEIRYYKK